MQEMLLMQNLPLRARSMSFPEMVKSSEIFSKISKNLKWLFPPICNRKDQPSLTGTERSRYVCAFNMLNNDGTLGELVDIHHGFYGQHSNPPLLPWHRIFLMLFEEALHNYHPMYAFPIGIGPVPKNRPSLTGSSVCILTCILLRQRST